MRDQKFNHFQQTNQAVKMARSQTSVSVAVAATSSAKVPKKTVAVTKGNGRVQKKPTTHPPVYEMIVAALKALKARKGSSLYAIKNYIGANYQCSVDKLSPFIKKALKSGIEKGTLIRTTGVGATGSFKLANAQAAAAGKVMPSPGKKQ